MTEPIVWTFTEPHPVGVVCWRDCPYCGGNPWDYDTRGHMQPAIPLLIVREAPSDGLGYAYEVLTD